MFFSPIFSSSPVFQHRYDQRESGARDRTHTVVPHVKRKKNQSDEGVENDCFVCLFVFHYFPLIKIYHLYCGYLRSFNRIKLLHEPSIWEKNQSL